MACPAVSARCSEALRARNGLGLNCVPEKHAGGRIALGFNRLVDLVLSSWTEPDHDAGAFAGGDCVDMKNSLLLCKGIQKGFSSCGNATFFAQWCHPWATANPRTISAARPRAR